MAYAHTLPELPPDRWEPLEDHLSAVEDLASQFAERFHAGDWGKLLGRWHDMGKYSEEFQAYLLTANGFEAHMEAPRRVDHSTAGAQHAMKQLGQLGRVIAYCIAGHHAGLANATSGGAASGLDQRLKKTIPDWHTAPEEIQNSLTLSLPDLSFDSTNPQRASFQLSLFCRMLFSALVDADFLSTETFMSPDTSAQRPKPLITIHELSRRLDEQLDHICKMATLHNGGLQNVVNTCRQQVLSACREASNLPPGLFSLTVPTGGGKTLSSLSFALRHAAKNGLQRVIYAIPFTSIIEQTARVFREALETDTGTGQTIVLEHHSNIEDSARTPQSRLAAENWDGSVVVTTNVQFFETLFASRPSRCRKLHRIANSVVILDEVQTLPVHMLKPCLAVLRELAADYQCSIVLCTATQPAIEWRPEFPIGLQDVSPIIQDPISLYEKMKRVSVTSIGTLTDEELCQRLSDHERFLCIVNTRGHALRLFHLLAEQDDDPSLYHLSTLMCGQHRTATLDQIRGRLQDGRPCRVISTQLIEAGVDIDFPVVYRALAGIDSIAQAAGRCNREGRLRKARVFVFEPANVRLRGILASTASSTRELMPDHLDLISLAAVDQYFHLHYWKQQGDGQWDEHAIMPLLGDQPDRLNFQFRDAAEAFRMIDDIGVSVVVPNDEKAIRLIEQLRDPDRSRDLYRQLQQYHVRLFPYMVDALGPDIDQLGDGTHVLNNAECYDHRTGVRVDRAGTYEPEALVG